MKITVGHVSSKIASKDVRVLALVRNVCKARPAGFPFMPRYKQGMWDGYISLMTSSTSFPSGLLHLVIPALESRGYTVEVAWGDYSDNDYADIQPDMLNGVVLRPYQISAIEALLSRQRGIAKMATNSGKTEVMAAIVAALRNRKRTLIVVHRKELMYQAADRLHTRLGTRVGLIGDGVMDSGDMVDVAMIQTLHNFREEDLLDYFKDTEVLMVDECHHASSDTMMDVLYKIPGKYRFGFSGTPLKHDLLSDMKLISITGDIVVDVGNPELIEEGYSAKPTVYLHESYSPGSSNWDMNYQEAYTTHIVENEDRNKTIRDIAVEARRNGKVTLILVTRIDHGNILKDMIRCMFVHGSDSTERRQKMLEYMRGKGPGVYIASTIFDEGVDVPDVNVLILAGGGKSSIKLLQRVGRGLRRKKGSNVLEVHDFIDDTNEFLLNHSEDRIDVYNKEGFEIREVKATASTFL
jgi:superfamily II DNA or RNA helicase